MSRRACEDAIQAGQITINGTLAKLGDKVDPACDHVAWNGRMIRPTQKKNYTYLMLNKPRGYITSMTDPEGRKCVTDLLEGVHTRVYPVGRLDRVSEGLLLFTDDGEMADRLMHPGKHDVPKVYRVKVTGHPTQQQIDLLSSPLEIDGYTIRPATVSVTEEEEDAILHISLWEGRNRQIRKMCEAAGITIRRLTRVSIGQLKLNGLAVGRWRYLTPDEIDYLHQITKR